MPEDIDIILDIDKKDKAEYVELRVDNRRLDRAKRGGTQQPRLL